MRISRESGGERRQCSIYRRKARCRDEIESPWFVSYRELDQQARQLHDIANENRTWRHLDFWQYQTILHARLPRIHCRHCDKIATVKVNWAREHASFSWLFEAHVMALMTEMPVAAVARKVGEHDTRLWRIFHYYVERAMKEMDMTKSA
nr:helix-turn-helix domain-containing protein [Paenibacillus ehimensis]